MNSERIGRFTSSEIHRLLTYQSVPMTDEQLSEHKKEFPKSRKKNIDSWPGKAAETYIQETAMEARLGRALNSESQARTLSWGHALERYVFDKILPISYRYRGGKTIVHPDIPVWAGTPDVDRELHMDKETLKLDIVSVGSTIVGDQKCPFTLKSFCQFMDAKNITEIRENHEHGDKYYWQLVSNAELLKCEYAELLIYVPYKSELESIRDYVEYEIVEHYDQTRWILKASDEELPYLIEGGHYKNFNSILFPVPQEEKDYLTKHVLMAQDKLKTMLE